MLLLHLSDIHFRLGEIGTALDPNRYLRNELLSDAEKMCTRIGRAPEAILLSGDVAFGGHPEEYEFALSWLEQLCSRCGASPASIFVIPGNHDVSMSVVSDTVTRMLHCQIKSQSDVALDSVVSGLLTSSEGGRLLYGSIANYNMFAAHFLCDLLPPERTIAVRDLTLRDRSVLRLHGLNSTFVSSGPDKRGDLFLDPACFQIPRERGVANLVMCHHPFSWLRQGDRLQDHLNDVAQIQLFGHEHTQRIELGRDWVRVAASAAHPDRAEPGWEPGYNLIEVDVIGEGNNRLLSVSTHVRVWQQRPGQFREKLDRNDESVFQNTIRLDSWTPPNDAKEPASDKPVEDVVRNESQAPLELEGSEKMDALREVSVRFFKLSLSQKAAIAGKLNLFEEDDVNRPDFERFRQVLIRARERGLVEALDQEVRTAMAKSSSSKKGDLET